MIITTQTARDAMLAPIRDVSGQVAVQDGDEVFTASDYLKTITIQSVGYYFGAVARSATIKLLGTNYSLVNAKLQVAMIIEAQSGAEELVNLGTFQVVEQATDKEKSITTLTAYDAMGILGKTNYQADAVRFPCTVADLALQIAVYADLSILTDMTTLPNADHVITRDLYSNISAATFRDVLAEVAGTTATMAIINQNNELEFRKPMRTPVDRLNYSNLIKLSVTPKYGPINSVVLARTPQEDNIYVRDEESIALSGLTELKLANNEILDQDRQSLAQPILEAVEGFSFHPCTATTTGQGWYEVGDRITITDDSDTTYETIITETSLTLDGGIRETIKGEAPTATQTNYALAGGVMRTLNTTEIKVNKQEQVIDSTVGRQEAFENIVNDNFTNINQSITNVITSVQNSGGSNLLQNSVGYVVTDGVPDNWEMATEEGGQVTVSPSSEAAAAGSVSKNTMVLQGATLTQRVSVVSDLAYSFSAKIKKTSTFGYGSITITDGVNTYQISIDTNDGYNYRNFSLKDIKPKNNYLDIIVYGSIDSDFTVTDMMLATGDYSSKWTQANGEFSNTQVDINVGGVRVKTNSSGDSYTEQNALAFKGIESSRTVFELSKAQVMSEKAVISKEFDMPPLKIISLTNGWVIVKKENG